MDNIPRTLAGRPFAKIIRYGMASVGPIGSAGAQFVLSLVLLQLLAPARFGSFSFLLVATNFSWGLWSALFCAPLPILLNEDGGSRRAAVLRCLFTTNLVVALLAGLAFVGIASALGLPVGGAAIFGGYSAVALLRWFARAYAYATGEPLRTMASDLVYCAALLVGIGLALSLHVDPLEAAFAAMLAGVALGLLPFGTRYLAGQFGSFSLSALPDYLPVWRRFAGWSLLGVLTTEATANSHAYIVTALIGPTAFAPIAASALTVRPMSVAMNALTEFERASMARQVGERRIDEARSSVRHFRWALIVVWLGTVMLVAALLAFKPRLIFPAKYDLVFLVVAGVLWMLVAAVRMLRTPESALLQAAGAFRPLALASVWSSGVSIVTVLLLLGIGGTLWSIAGILLGELIYAVVIWRQMARWSADQRAVESAEPDRRLEPA